MLGLFVVSVLFVAYLILPVWRCLILPVWRCLHPSRRRTGLDSLYYNRLSRACRGVLFAITQGQARQLQAARGDDASVLNMVREEIVGPWDAEHLCDTHLAWNPIHRCLGDGTLGSGEGPLSLCILGGEQLHRDEGYIVSLVTPKQVEQVAGALRPLEKEWLRAGYYKIVPADYWIRGALNEETFEYTWWHFEGVRRFYQKAAGEGRWVIFYREPVLIPRSL